VTRSRDTHADSGAFVVRSPLLPYATLDGLDPGRAALAAYADGGDLDAAVDADLAALAETLRALLDDPVVREAIFLASPSLDERIDGWLAGEDGAPVRPVLSYVTRMAGRPTPFGLFAGCAVGRIGATTSLVLPGRDEARRHTRLDFGFLAKVVTALQADPAAQPFLTLVPNTSLYRAGGRLRMAEARVDERGVRYHRVTFEEDEALAATLDRARGGARLGDLAAALADDEVTVEEAEEYVRELVGAQLLVSDLGPVVTGDEPVAVAALLAHERTAPVGAALVVAGRELRALDDGGPGADRARYRALAETLCVADPDLRLDRLFQVDLAKPGPDLALGEDVVTELYRAVDVLHGLTRSQPGDELGRFREAFAARYEQREVPLAEALDEEVGVGYGPPAALAAEGAPLLAGLVPARTAAPGPAWTAADAYLLRLLARALSDGATEVELTAADLAALAGDDPPPLPDALCVSAVVAGEGDGVRVVVEGAAGPSGARLLGRFCHLDPDLEALVRRHLAEEEKARPDVVLAEVVHLPEGRVGNILARPVLRPYEIPFLAAPGVGPDGRLPLDDLLVSVAGGRVVLRSRRLGREVVPRITNAHNTTTGALAVYRFLGALQYQGVAGWLGWSWGSLQSAPFLPRVTYGRLVLARAQWFVSGGDLKPLVAARTAAQRFRAVQDVRAAARLPRRVVVSVGDNDLPVDLDTVGGCELFAHEARRGALRLVEAYPGPDDLPLATPEGRFAHEVVLPIARRAAVPAAGWLAGSDEGVESVFPPGSEWLTAKLYTGKATADAVLREAVAPLVHDVADVTDGWFFLRYADPEDHLRLRFHGDPAALSAEVLPRLRDAAAPLLADGRVWRVQLDTYRREVARYGGPAGVLRAERVFHADSEAALAIVLAAEGDEGLGRRWRLALLGVDRLLADGGLDVPARRAAVRRWRDMLAAEHGATGDAAKRHAGRLFRTERATLADLLERGHPAYERRSAAIRPLDAPEDVLGSLAHMHVNRLLRAAQRTQELVVYDLLDRLYAAAAGRARAGS
jgi:thiopeptide-type bacteriocin biosynthesis protein